MPLRMNMQSGRKHKSKLDVWENQWSGSLAAPLIFCYPSTKYFEMSEDCNNSACFRVAFWRTSDVSVTVAFYNDSINKETCLPSGRKENRCCADRFDVSQRETRRRRKTHPLSVAAPTLKMNYTM